MALTAARAKENERLNGGEPVIFKRIDIGERKSRVEGRVVEDSSVGNGTKIHPQHIACK
jgi:hypothetical protein